MDNLLNLESLCYSRCLADGTEECGFNGDYILPEYCANIASVLKCTAEPRLQSRQFSGDNLLLDGVVNLRVVYVDEERCRLHSVEFSVPYSCTLHGIGGGESVPVFFDFATKYVNCRVTGPRRLEVFGAVQINVCAYDNITTKRAVPAEQEGLHTRQNTVKTSRLVGFSEKVITVSEALEFPESLPAAERLLGGTCTALAKEWKVLNGKVIARGVVQIHQLYTDNHEKGSTHCLDFEVPFSQILDVPGVQEGHLCCGEILLLTDTEYCSVGPDGGNTLLEINVKMMLQVHVYEKNETQMLVEAYHTQYPIEQDLEDVEFRAYSGCSHEQTVLPMLLDVSDVPLQEIVDVWVSPQSTMVTVENQVAAISGTMAITLLGRGADGDLVCLEKAEEYRMEFPSLGNEAKAHLCVCGLRYRAVDGKLELQVSLCVRLWHYCVAQMVVVREIRLNTDQPYPSSRAGALLYYAQPGESLWEIGRACHTSPELIRQENESVSEIVTAPCVLMVPMV